MSRRNNASKKAIRRAEEFDSEIQLFDDKASKNASKHTDKGHKRHAPIIIIIICAVLILFGVLFILFRNKQAEILELQIKNQEQLDRYFNIMNSETFLPGVQIDGIDVSGLTASQAGDRIQEAFQAKYSKPIACSYKDMLFDLDLMSLDPSSNLETILSEAMDIAKTESPQESVDIADRLISEGISYDVSYEFNTEKLNEFIRGISEQINISPSEASIDTIDRENHTVTYKESVIGLSVDEETFRNDLLSCIEQINSEVQIPVREIQPEKHIEDFKMIEIEFNTSFKGSSSNRIFNIKKGADLINGTVLSPGEVFSANDTLGVRTYSKGWKEANAYVGGTTDPQAGGGVCQLSSTLYNTAVKSDLEIVFRRNHSLPVDYISKGLDATINSVGNIIDFKFKNNTPMDLVIFSWTEGKNLYFKIVRCPFETDEYDEIRLTAEKIQTLHPEGEMEEILDETLMPGEEVVEVARRDGAIYQSYKHFYKNGTLVRTEKLDRSTYPAFDGVLRIGPLVIGPTVSPDPYYPPSVTPEPSDEPDVTPVPDDPAPTIPPEEPPETGSAD